jgi:hypothetical protein
MATQTWTEADTERAKEVWQKYQLQHDVSDRIGQAVGIDPDSGAVHFGASAGEVVMRLAAEGRQPTLLFLRVGYNHYIKKVGRRWLRAK